MAVTIRIPTTLRPLTAGAGEVEVEGATVGEALVSLEVTHPGFGSRILDESGALRRFVNVFVSDEDVRFLDGLETTIPDGATVAIVPAVAGG
ncbi:MAG: MoaD/ThiS family protein [Actinobacteria bacterium]|nr:MoaD/ThiS family protein [Actinomycetota bacterium]